jgi:MFS family permease
MDRRNRIGLYGAYFLGMSGIGFTLPFLPLYLSERELSESAIGGVSTVAALAGLLQFPVDLWSDRLDRRKPFLLVALALLIVTTIALGRPLGLVALSVLVALFAENGACRATIESLAGAEVARLSPAGALGAGRRSPAWCSPRSATGGCSRSWQAWARSRRCWSWRWSPRR